MPPVAGVGAGAPKLNDGPPGGGGGGGAKVEEAPKLNMLRGRRYDERLANRWGCALGSDWPVELLVWFGRNPPGVVMSLNHLWPSYKTAQPRMWTNNPPPLSRHDTRLGH